MHGDLCGLVTPATPRGRRFFLLLVDDVSCYMWAVLLDTKAAAADAIKCHQAAVECGRKLRVLRTDNGGEFMAAGFATGAEKWRWIPLSAQYVANSVAVNSPPLSVRSTRSLRPHSIVA